jgi:YidC/Oxa1 family membrane protein insertase
MSTHNQLPTPDENRRLMTAFALSILVLVVYFVFYQQPKMAEQRAQLAQQEKVIPTLDVAGAPKTQGLVSVEEALAGRVSVSIETKRLTGSIALKGARLDDLQLKSFKEHIDSAEPLRLLAPSGTREAQFVEHGFMPADESVAVPDQNSVWRVVGAQKIVQVNKPVTLEWANNQGLTFRRTYHVDAHYVFTVEQAIINKSGKDVTLYPYALVSQSHHVPQKGERVAFEDKPSAVMHTGGVAYLNGDLVEEDYGDLKGEKPFSYQQVKGWLGITSKYWLVALLPQQDQSFDARLSHQAGVSKEHDIFQADMRGTAITVKNGTEETLSQSVFAGAKQLNLLNQYEEELGIPHFDLAIDFGWLYFITKPLYRLLHFLGDFFAGHGYAMSFAMALLTMTVLVRLLTFPLANKAFRSMAKMKQVGPQMQLLKEQHGKDKERFQKEIIALYKREKVNPASGCIPMLIQIPIFFALYKVLFVSIDMRHQPFWGWIHDMSAPDTTSIFNLFGLIPWTPPTMLMLGAWPLLYGLTLWLQQKMQPAPEDPVQKQVMAMFPWIFMFLFAQFPAGLVIYYVWSNLLGIVQQYVIKRQVESDGLVVMPVKDAKKPRGKKAKDMPTIIVPDDHDQKA